MSAWTETRCALSTGQVCLVTAPAPLSWWERQGGCRNGGRFGGRTGTRGAHRQAVGWLGQCAGGLRWASFAAHYAPRRLVPPASTSRRLRGSDGCGHISDSSNSYRQDDLCICLLSGEDRRCFQRQLPASRSRISWPSRSTSVAPARIFNNSTRSASHLSRIQGRPLARRRAAPATCWPLIISDVPR